MVSACGGSHPWWVHWHWLELTMSSTGQLQTSSHPGHSCSPLLLTLCRGHPIHTHSRFLAASSVTEWVLIQKWRIIAIYTGTELKNWMRYCLDFSHCAFWSILKRMHVLSLGMSLLYLAVFHYLQSWMQKQPSTHSMASTVSEERMLYVSGMICMKTQWFLVLCTSDPLCSAV